MLSGCGINAYYGMSHVLHDLSIRVRKGEAACLLGRNGVGKSTTLKSVIGLVRIRSGDLFFKHESIRGLPPHEIAKRGIGYVPEDRRIFRNLTVRENLKAGEKPAGAGGKSTWNQERIFSLFPDLARLSSQKGGRLSGGEQQMLAIARTLMGNPELLLLDEPSEGLAPLVIKAIRARILIMKQEGITLLLSEQNLKFAETVCDRAFVMEKGRIRIEGQMGEIAQSEEIRRNYLTL